MSTTARILAGVVLVFVLSGCGALLDIEDVSDGHSPDGPLSGGPSPDGPPPELLTTPALLLPPRGSNIGSVHITGSLRPTFVWTPAATIGAVPLTYELEVTSDASFLSGVSVVTTTVTSHTPAADLQVRTTAPVGARLYWRVRACAGEGCSAYSSASWVDLGRVGPDFNGDGFSDVVVGGSGIASVHFGAHDRTAGILAAPTASQGFGGSVAAAGDVNGDGFADVVVGMSRDDAEGRAYVYFGGPGATFDASVDGTLAMPGARFSAVSSAGDVNGDGFADIIVGAPNVQRAYLYLGGSNATVDASVDAVLTGAAGDDFGHAVASAGDVNQDGFGDVIVGAPRDRHVYVYFGGAGDGFDTSADGVLLGGVGDCFGCAVASAGDVNGDGFADVLVGAHLNDNDGSDTGRVVIYFGGSGGSLDAAEDRTLPGSPGDGWFGYSVGPAGDVNGDGLGDIVVGAPGSDSNGTDTGRAYVYWGGPRGGFDIVSDGTLVGEMDHDALGASVAGAGDVNGDGFADVIVGAPGDPSAGRREGLAQIYLGGVGTALDPHPDRMLSGSAGFGRSVAFRATGRTATVD